MREMVGGCCVCSDERGWAENPLVYCDGHGCSVAVHQACYGIVQVPTGPWFCRKCESQERAARVRCELCPHKDGALKRTDSGGWAHVVCALYIPEVQFANVLTMEPIVLQYVPHDRYIKTCYICEDHGRESKAACGACMTCNRQGCRQAFHVTCAQMAGLLCEEEGPEADNVKYCGYCKHHYSKMQKKMRSSGENTERSSFGHSRGRSTSPSQDKHGSHHHRPRKSHKDKMRQKERHKKSSDGQGSSLSSSMDKLSSGHHGNKDSEGNSKRLSSHSQLGHRSKKTGSIGKSCSSSSCSSSPFNTGGGSQDFLPFSSTSRLECDPDRGEDEHGAEEHHEERTRRTAPEEDDEEEEEEREEEKEEEEELDNSKYHNKASMQPPALTPVDGPHGGSSQGHERSEGEASSFETKVTISTFGSIMRITSSSGGLGGGSSKLRKISSSSSSGDYKPSKSLLKSPHLATPPILEEADLEEDKATPPPPLPTHRERRHRGNKKSRHGPGRPRGSKNRERTERREEEYRQHHHHTAPAPPPPLTSSTLSSSLFPSSPTLPHTAYSSTLHTSSLSSSSFPSSSTSSSVSFSTGRGNTLLGSGNYISHKDPLSLSRGVCNTPLSLGGGVCTTPLSLGGGICSTALSSGLLPSHVSTLSLQPVNSAPNTQVHPCSSSSYNLSSSQPFGRILSTAPTLPSLLSQAQTSLPESEMDDCRFPCHDNSPRESLSSQSPMSSLPLLFDQREGVGTGVRGRPENVPPSSFHIELLLEKHGNGEMGANIVEMLQSLHSLQQENQRLQDQILSLTAKKERLQLLNVELACSFPLQVHHSHHSAQGLVPTPTHISFLSSAHDPLSTNKSPLSKSCFLNDTSFITSSEELHSGSPSRSSSSLSFQSTPPPQQSPASFGQPLLNGLGGRGLTDSLGGLNQASSSMVGGLMASLAGSPQLNMNGVLGSLNGVIQSPVQNAPQPTLPALRPQPPPLGPQTLAQGLQLPKSMSPSSLLSEQQKQLLLQQHFTPEQQVVVYQMLQQQRQRELQRLTLTGALTSTPTAQSPNLGASPLQGGQGNALFGLQENALHKPGGMGEKGGDKNG
ncbi:protein AF-17-like isoform X1 [Coregonus clupeaformis]|uniref:protein AF-17-like isoform X1 n=1 Tax=Coregonus clupeaformis TaxID=59861 RepID=UPI001E1C5DD6|nr:protein AF-17-like isoform X1 [Coregonus clupeaformis]